MAGRARGDILRGVPLRSTTHRRLAIPLLLALFGGCQAAPPAGVERDYTLVVLKTGPRTGLTDSARQQVFAGHFANMNRLAREGHLVLAGPYGEQRSDRRLRGVFVFATADRREAEHLAASDPGVQAGVFVAEFLDLRTPAPLGALLRAELAAEDAMLAAGKTPAPGEFGRPFVLLVAEEGAAALLALRGNPAVLLTSRIDGHGAWIVLDATDLQGAEVLLAPVRDQLGPYHLDEWFATKRVAELPRMAPR